MEYKQTKAYMLHKLNTAFESFNNLSSHHVNNHKAMIEFFESNSDKIKDVSLEYCEHEEDGIILEYSFTSKPEISNGIIFEFFDNSYTQVNTLIDKKYQILDFFNTQDLKDFLKTEIFN